MSLRKQQQSQGGGKSVRFDFCSSINQKNEEIRNPFPTADTTKAENQRASPGNSTEDSDCEGIHTHVQAVGQSTN